MRLNYKVICITGTPGVGKTTITKLLNKEALKKSKIFSINEIATNNDLIIGYDEEKSFNIVDMDKLDNKFSEIVNNEERINDLNVDYKDLKHVNERIAIVDGHLSHLCSRCDKVIVLRINPNILKKRLTERDYSKTKIKDNIESEVLGICSYEANEIHGDKVSEVDTSNLTAYQVLQICVDIIQDKNHLPIGEIDFMDYFLRK
ncbi:MAG: adenylate kinase family protein [Methanobrevibacter sp.]|jgi:adenylate kinase|nr:adenylate kinase family protein [Candidatus Methanovirga basalitermitum]